MLSGPELIVLIVMVLVVLAVLVLVGARQHGRSNADGVRTVVVPDAAQPWLVGVVADLHALKKHSVTTLSPEVTVLTWTRRSAWGIAIALLLFPLGLIALLFTVKEHGTIAVVAQGPPASIALSGQFSNAAVDTINRHIPDRTPTPA